MTQDSVTRKILCSQGHLPFLSAIHFRTNMNPPARYRALWDEVCRRAAQDVPFPEGCTGPCHFVPHPDGPKCFLCHRLQPTVAHVNQVVNPSSPSPPSSPSSPTSFDQDLAAATQRSLEDTPRIPTPQHVATTDDEALAIAIQKSLDMESEDAICSAPEGRRESAVSKRRRSAVSPVRALASSKRTVKICCICLDGIKVGEEQVWICLGCLEQTHSNCQGSCVQPNKCCACRGEYVASG